MEGPEDDEPEELESEDWPVDEEPEYEEPEDWPVDEEPECEPAAADEAAVYEFTMVLVEAEYEKSAADEEPDETSTMEALELEALELLVLVLLLPL